MNVIDQTRAICPHCKTSHSAELLRDGDKVIGAVHCPLGESRQEISSDADLFLSIRRKQQTDLSAPESFDGSKNLLHYITITNGCDMHCALCMARARSEAQHVVFLPVAEIVRRAEASRRKGGRVFYLFGGEPTLHPDLLTIVDRLVEMGLRLNLVTNGIRLGTETTLAAELKRHGLKRILIQFDSLDEATLERLGRNALAVKRAAIDNAVRAGLHVALNCVATPFNLHETGVLIDFAASQGVHVHNLQFNTATPVGRFDDSLGDSPDRECIVREILLHGPRLGFSEEDLLPLPYYRPWGLRVHPDCGVFFLFMRTKFGLVPLTRMLDASVLYKRMSQCRLRPSFFSKWMLPLWFALRAIKPGHRREALRVFVGMLVDPKHYSFLNVTVSNFKIASFLDEKRLARCATAFLAASGPVEGCLHFIMDETYPGSKLHEDACSGC